MSKFWILLKKDLLEITRTKKWLIYILVFAMITVFSVVSARLLPEVLNSVLEEIPIEGIAVYEASVADSYVQYIANMGEIAWILIAIMFSTALFKEKQQGTYQLLMSSKVSEKEIVLSHFVSKLILLTISFLTSVLIFVPLNLIIFKEYTGLRGVVALGYVYLSLIFALTLSLFISSFIDKKGKGYLLAIIFYFALTILAVIPDINILSPYTGLTLASDIIIYPEYQTGDYIVNLIVNIASIVLLLVLSTYFMKNKINNRKKVF